MFGIGAQELLVIGVIALLVFGPKRLPELARSLGRGLAEFRRASTDLRRSLSMEGTPEPPRSPVAEDADSKSTRVAHEPTGPAQAAGEAPAPEPEPQTRLQPKPKPQPQPQAEPSESKPDEVAETGEPSPHGSGGG
jgi:TatA/E family protein of Tat protein translocase